MKIGVSAIFVFFVVEREETGKRNGNWNFWILVFCSKNGRFVTHMFFFKKKFAETPIFIVFLGCALLGPSCQKREILDTHPKKKKILTDN